MFALENDYELEETPIFVRGSNYVDEGWEFQESNMEGSYPQENIGQ